MKKFVALIFAFFISAAVIGGFYLFEKRQSILRDALNYAENFAADYIGTQIKIGNAEIQEFNISKLQDSALLLSNIQVFDKNSELIAQVDSARVTFKLLNFFDFGAGAIDEINIDGARAFLTKREDNSWNVQDIQIKDTGESTFDAKINLREGSVTANFDGKSVAVDEINISADCADMDAIDTNLSAKLLGSQIVADGTLGMQRQILNAFIDSADVVKILAYLPADILPDKLSIYGGTVTNVALNILRRGTLLSYSGSASFHGGAILLEDTEITGITGNATFTDSEYNLDANAAANGQLAHLNGKIRTDTDELFFDINADSNNFVPAAILPAIGIDGAANFTAHIFGTVNDPKVDADISSNYLAYQNISAQNVKANLRYVNNAVFLSNVSADTFGGNVTGEAELSAKTLAYNAHVKADSIDISALRNWLDTDIAVFGKLNADIDLNGNGDEFSTLTAYGAASANNLSYQNFVVNKAESSFYLRDDDIQFDYLNLKLPNGGTVNLEGAFTDLKNLDFNFYGAHIDLALAKRFEPALDIGGLSDFSGSVHGNIDNPKIELKLSAVDDLRGNFKGEIFNQQYDSLKVAMAGSWDAVTFELLELEKDGLIQWQVMDGWINLKQRTLNIRLDTVGARLESIVKLIAPDQNLTGDIDNTIRLKGTFDNPELIGYVEMKYGSYNGFLINSMRGDYFIEEGDNLRLQDFEIITPMLDMVVNGKINIKTYALDFVVSGREIDLRRFQRQFPYEVSGNGKFEGLIGGTVDKPIFDGQLTAALFTFNGVDLKNIKGHINATGDTVTLDDFNFRQGGGTYSMHLTADLSNRAMNGRADVRNADIDALARLATFDAKNFSGKLTSHIDIGGNFDNPAVKVLGEITDGAIGKYDLRNIQLDVDFKNYVADIRRFSGSQGAGTFNLSGSADLYGKLNLLAAAADIDLGIFGALAQSDVDISGTANLNAKLSGDVNNPVGDLVFSATGAVSGSAFDLLRGHMTFADWIFNLRELTVERSVAGKLISASAYGTLPWDAIFADSDSCDLHISLDDADLSLLPVLSKSVAFATGDLGGNLNIKGTAANPQIFGDISLSGGTVQFKALHNPVQNISLASNFAGDQFSLSNFSGNLGNGTFNLTGNLSFADFIVRNYDFNFVADNLDLQSSFFSGPLNAEFDLTEERFWGQTLPKVAGHIDLDKCLFSIPTIPDSDDPLPEILLDVSINLGEKVHFYSSRLYNMFLTGSVKFEGSTTHPKSTGTISAKRGATLTYLQTVFDVREGELYFNQMESFFPSLNFRADTRLTDTQVNLAVTGTLNNADIRLTSNPEKSQTEIVQILTLRDAYGNQTSEMTMADVLAIGLQLSILGDVEDTVKRNLGLDRFTFASGSGSALDNFSSKDLDNGERNEDFHISIGKYVTDKLMLRYTQGITGERVQRYGFQYDINDNLGFTVERENKEFIFSLEARYKF